MNNNSKHNYDSYTDCFAETEHVQSTLLYGDLEAIPKPWITVIIPTYDRTDLLKQALESLLYQGHCSFFWDIVVIDNEPNDGKRNRTEKLIREIDSKRVLYYRNSERMTPADILNRGVKLARGEWISILFDDDLLISNSLQNFGKLIGYYEKLPGKPLGAISSMYIQFEYDPDTEKVKIDIPGTNGYISSLPTEYRLYKLTHNTIFFTSHIGGYASTSGAAYKKEAVIKVGGFNKANGDYADLIMFYQMENYYTVYSTLTPYGFYRWGCETSGKPKLDQDLIKESCDFREYVYSRNAITRFFGKLLRNCHYKKYTTDLMNQKMSVSKDKLKLEDFDSVYSGRPSRLIYFVYAKFVVRAYRLFKRIQSKHLAKGAKQFEKEYYF